MPREETMADGVDKAFIQTLAEANGIAIPEERLEVVLKQYQTYLELWNRLDSLPLDMGAEPSATFALPTEGTGAVPPRQKR